MLCNKSCLVLSSPSPLLFLLLLCTHFFLIDLFLSRFFSLSLTLLFCCSCVLEHLKHSLNLQYCKCYLAELYVRAQMCGSCEANIQQLRYKLCVMSNSSQWCGNSRPLSGEFTQRRSKQEHCDSCNVPFTSPAPPLAWTKPSSYCIPSRWECVWHELSCLVHYRRLFTPPLPHTKHLFSFSPSSVCLSPSHIFSPCVSRSVLTLYNTVLSMTLHFTTRASCSATLPGGQLAFFTTHQGYCPGFCVCRCVFVWSQSHQVYCGGWQCSGPVNQFLL